MIEWRFNQFYNVEKIPLNPIDYTKQWKKLQKEYKEDKDLKNKAREIIAFVEYTCSDFGHQAYYSYKEFGTSMTSPETDREIKIMEEHGVHDIPGSLADNLYNHAGFCEDVLGDRIYGDCEGNLQTYLQLAEEVKKQSTNQAMKQACNNIIRRWRNG